MQTSHIQHLYWRAGFGILPNQLFNLKNLTRQEVVDQLFTESESVKKISVDLSELKGIKNPLELRKNKELRLKIVEFNKKKGVELNKVWVTEIANNKAQLRERMTLFWANHFVCQESNAMHIQQFINVLRVNALGNFGEFVKAVSKKAAMIKYLNAKQNRKSKPNENFARELMELFTLGVGNYTEEDIKQSARAFTGYNHNFRGDFVLRRLQHDYGQKTFFGQTGDFDGDNIIDIILEQKQCARFICEKIYRYFVNENIVKQHINEMVSVFYGDYDISKLMRFVFLQDWFYDEKNIGTKIKSPIDFLVGVHRTIPLKFKGERDLMKLQHLLGQVLLRPPNVAGWKGGSSWIDVNTIMVRLRMASLLVNHAQIPHKEKGDFNDAFRKYYFKKNKKKLPFKVEANWDAFFSNYGHYSNATLQQNLLNTKLNNGTEAFLRSLNKSSLRDYCIQLMSLPEYQMC
ncbi:DUF1800 family protein [Winogradskyella sp. 3972H.M.0a.05]|uniref:DUF1800 domain-containing protein n=1 Tax=Winogradskyella sp. 3972H.M.0a.05 TaxID=2950277 RepID=UPI00339B3BA6